MTKPTSVEQPTLISMVLGFVQNFLPDFSAAEIIWVRSMKASKFAVFNVQCRSVVSATRVKSTFASIVKSANKPAYIKDISISFAHTVGTRVRISLMRAMSKRQKEKDPNAVCSVSAFTSRPLLCVGGKDQGTRFLSFVDAIAGFRHLLTQDDLDKALSLCSGQKGRLKSKYLVLSDDRILPPYQGRKQPRGAPGQVPTSQPPGGQQQAPQAPPPGALINECHASCRSSLHQTPTTSNVWFDECSTWTALHSALSARNSSGSYNDSLSSTRILCAGHCESATTSGTTSSRPSPTRPSTCICGRPCASRRSTFHQGSPEESTQASRTYHLQAFNPHEEVEGPEGFFKSVGDTRPDRSRRQARSDEQ